MAGFVQIIEFSTSRIDEIRALVEEFRAGREGSDDMSVARGTFTADRDQPGRYLNIVEFASYEAAMENSNRPETAEFAAKLAGLCDGPPQFRNLDLVETWQG
jgi:quinol monooxygenase YgiN